MRIKLVGRVTEADAWKEAAPLLQAIGHRGLSRTKGSIASRDGFKQAIGNASSRRPWTGGEFRCLRAGIHCRFMRINSVEHNAPPIVMAHRYSRRSHAHKPDQALRRVTLEPRPSDLDDRRSCNNAARRFLTIADGDEAQRCSNEQIALAAMQRGGPAPKHKPR